MSKPSTKTKKKVSNAVRKLNNGNKYQNDITPVNTGNQNVG